MCHCFVWRNKAWDSCDDPCAWDDSGRYCMYDRSGGVMQTFECAAAFKCAANEMDADYEIYGYGACETPTEDECTLGDIRMTDEYVATHKCPMTCQCVENPRDADYGNVWVCDTIDAQFENLKERCVDKLGDVD